MTFARSSALWGIALMALALAAPAHAETPVEASPDIDALVIQLADPDPTKVAAAKQKLIELGDASRPALERFVRSRATAEAVLATIETNKVAGPTMITLKLADAKPEAVLDALSKQTGYTLRPFNRAMWDNRGNRQTVTVNYQNQPFWEVIADLCQKAQIAPYFDGSATKQVLFVPAGQMGQSIFTYPSSTNGAIISMMTNLSRQKSISLSGRNSNNNSFNAQMMVMFEPKIRVSGYGYQPTLEEAVDDHGNSLIPRADGNSNGMNSVSRQSQLNFGINLAYPATNPGTKIVRLRGKYRLAVAVRTETVEFTHLTDDKEQTKPSPGGARITLQSVKPTDNAGGGNNRQYIVQATLARDKMDPRQFNEMTNAASVRLVDAQNHEYQFQGNRDSSNNGQESTISMQFYRRSVDDGGEDVGEPVKLMWEIATESKDINVPFEFKDLPMP